MTEFSGPHTNSVFQEMAERTTVLRTEVGSGLYGLAIEGTDDRDEMGVCVEDKEFVLGIGKFDQYEFRTKPQGVRSGSGDLDLNIYSLRKYVRLTVHGNPTSIMPLFAPHESVVTCTPIGAELRDRLSKMVVHKESGKRFLGYLRAQREQMLGQRAGRRHANRPELIERYGYDTKFASHMCRLGFQGVELLRTGTIILPMPVVARSYLREMKVGLVSQQDALDLAEYLEGNLQNLLQHNGDLPERADIEEADALLVDIYERYWSGEE